MKKSILRKGLMLALLACIGYMKVNAAFIVIFIGDNERRSNGGLEMGNFLHYMKCKGPKGVCPFFLPIEAGGRIQFNLDIPFQMAGDDLDQINLVSNTQKLLNNGQYSGRIVVSSGIAIPGQNLERDLGEYAKNLLDAGERKDVDYIRNFKSDIHFSIWNFTINGNEISGYIIVN